MLAITPNLGVNGYNNEQKTPNVDTPGETKTPHEILMNQLVSNCNQLTFSRTAHAPPS